MIATAQRSGNVRFDWTHLCADGSPIPVEVTLTPVILRGETLIHTAWRDITERQRIQHQLMMHQTQLEHMVLMRTQQLTTALDDAKLADRAKDEFLANISHELRTPLSAVIGFSGLARPLAGDPQLRDYLDKIGYAGRSLSGIINDLLDISKISAGRMEIETVTFRLSDLIARCQSMMAWKAEEKHLELVESTDADVPDVLMGDPLRLEQIILNLLSNAVKFTARGQVALRVSLSGRDPQRVGLQIEVEDSGIGMNAEQLQLLFKPFSQSDASISRRFGGTGLGLAICKHLCELMGGNIEVSSREGVGTTFRVTLWFAPGHADNLPQQDLQGGTDACTLHYQHARVLVVDDQPFNREIVTGLLGAVGITSDTASNGSEAVDLLLNAGPQTYDLVLMDIQMPVLDGLSATRALRSSTGFANLPIIAMTAHTMTHERTNSRDAGMNDHIGKPFDEAGFYAVIRKWIPPAKHLSAEVLTVAEPKAPPPSITNLPPLRGVDTQAGLSLLLGNETRYRHWLLSFIDEGPAFLAQARLALDEGRNNDAGIAIHTLKGRAGMLGMKALHALSAALEEKVDAGTTAIELFATTEQAVSAMCDEIRSVLGSSSSAETTTRITPAQESVDEPPQEPLPASIQHLLTLLEAGDGDCDSVLTACLAEHHGSTWEPRLQRAMIEVYNFRFAAARVLLCPGKD
jgi:signal transduction histidine kinase/CheY-like chemotaxis protein